MAWRAHWFQAASGDTEIKYTAQEDRAVVLQSLFSREGVLDLVAGDLKVSQRTAGSNYTVDIAIGRAAIRGDDVSDQGTYVVSNTTLSQGLAIPVSGSSSRTHQVILRVKDRLHNGSWSSYTGLPEVLVDTSYATALAVPSAIVLASVTVPANAASVTNAMITDQRPAASVGTADRTGTWTPRPDAYAANDSNRITRWAVNPDGWVSLGGWAVRTAANVTINSGPTLYDFTTSPLPAAILPSGSYRDFIGASSEGPVQFTVRTNGQLAFRFYTTVTLTQNVSWFSFDGCGYRL